MKGGGMTVLRTRSRSRSIPDAKRTRASRRARSRERKAPLQRAGEPLMAELSSGEFSNVADALREETGGRTSQSSPALASPEDLLEDTLGFGAVLAQRERAGRIEDFQAGLGLPGPSAETEDIEANLAELTAQIAQLDHNIERNIENKLARSKLPSTLETPIFTPNRRLVPPRNEPSPPLTGTISIVECADGTQPHLSWHSTDNAEESAPTNRAVVASSDYEHERDPDMRVTMATLDNFQTSMRSAMHEQLIALKARLDDRANAEVRQIKDNYVAIEGRQSDEIRALKAQLAQTQAGLERSRTLSERMATQIAALKHKNQRQRICGAAMQLWRDNKTMIKCKEYTAERLALRFARRRMTRVMSLWHKKAERLRRARKMDEWKGQMEIVTESAIGRYERELEDAKATIAAQKHRLDFLEEERVQFEKRMKGALMRGVSALNLEAMSFMASNVPDETPQLESALTRQEEEMAAQAMLGSITPASEPLARPPLTMPAAVRPMRHSHSDRNVSITPRSSMSARLYPRVGDRRAGNS